MIYFEMFILFNVWFLSCIISYYIGHWHGVKAMSDVALKTIDDCFKKRDNQDAIKRIDAIAERFDKLRDYK